jgi:hypothetical protein
MGCHPNKDLFERSLKRFLLINLGKVKEKRFNCLSPKSEFWKRLERDSDLSENVSEPAIKDSGDRPSSCESE